jgi:sulfur-oxidizing protein SoxY
MTARPAKGRKTQEKRQMQLSRRNVMIMGAGAFVAFGLPMRASAAADDMIAEFTGGAAMADTGITLTAPEIAENGNTVPIEVSAPGAEAILILATGNPTPGVAQFNFGPLAGSQYGSTRIRLAGTQDVVAIARMQDGSFARASRNVKVTIGGCGG